MPSQIKIQSSLGLDLVLESWGDFTRHSKNHDDVLLVSTGLVSIEKELFYDHKPITKPSVSVLDDGLASFSLALLRPHLVVFYVQ